MEDLEATSAAAAAKLASNPPKAPEGAERLYNRDEVMKMIKASVEEFHRKDASDTDDINEDDGPRKHTIRMARIKDKFIIGIKNLNTDPYFPDLIVYSQDIFNDQTRQNVPHMTVILEDKSELTLPIETLFKISKTIVVPLIERKQVNNNKKLGMVEVQEMKPDSYNPITTGETVLAKQKAFKETYVVQLPTMTEPIEVIPDVTNW